MHLPHQLLSATASLEKARIPLQRPNFKLIYSSAVHGFITLEASGLEVGISRLQAGEVHSYLAPTTGQLCDLGHTLHLSVLQVPSPNVKLE